MTVNRLRNSEQTGAIIVGGDEDLTLDDSDRWLAVGVTDSMMQATGPIVLSSQALGPTAERSLVSLASNESQVQLVCIATPPDLSVPVFTGELNPLDVSNAHAQQGT
jgi:hypothetical protein